MDVWKIGRKIRDHLTLEGNTTSAVESFLDGSCHACRCSRRFSELSCKVYIH